MLSRHARGFATALFSPPARLLVRAGVGPDAVTWVGTVGVSAAALWFYPRGEFFVGSVVVTVFVLFDSLDGTMARMTGRSSRWGAFLDSTLDRVGDGATFMGIGVYYLLAPAGTVANREWAIMISMAAIIASLLVSYARARAEGLGIDCKVGIAQRAERILGLGVASLLIGAGPRALVLEGIVALLAIASTITVVQRFVYVYRNADRVPPEPRVRSRERAALDPLAKGR